METQNVWAWIVGIVLVLVGILGFFNNPLLGLFPINITHNIIHIVSGLIFVWGAWGSWARGANQWMGVIYTILAIVGFFVPLTFLNMTSGSDPDNYLHLVIGIISIGVGYFAE